jgi:hypothetical protein
MWAFSCCWPLFSSARFSVHAAREQPQCRTSPRNVPGLPLGHSYIIPNLETQASTFQPLTLTKSSTSDLLNYTTTPATSAQHLEVTTVTPKERAPSTDWIGDYALRLLYHWKFSKVHISPRFAHVSQRSVCIQLYNESVQATSRSHTES